jgi:hypothetical protein
MACMGTVVQEISLVLWVVDIPAQPDMTKVTINTSKLAKRWLVFMFPPLIETRKKSFG